MKGGMVFRVLKVLEQWGSFGIIVVELKKIGHRTGTTLLRKTIIN